MTKTEAATLKENKKDVLLELHKEHYLQIRHYETQRSTVSNLLVIISAAILAFVTYDKALTFADFPLTFMLMIIGLFGAGFCIKYYERSTLNTYRVRKYRAELDKELFDSGLIQPLIVEAAKLQEEKFPRLFEGSLSWIKVHRLWIFFHLLVAFLGLILTISTIWLPQLPISEQALKPAPTQTPEPNHAQTPNPKR